MIFGPLKRWLEYRMTWGSRLGRDCISLDASLCAWLSERLRFIAGHHHSFPAERSSEWWESELRKHATTLGAYIERWDSETLEAELEIISDAQESMRWIADNLPTLWD